MLASDAAAQGNCRRAVLAALGTDPDRLLIVGGIGSGKSTALQIVRRSLRESGHLVTARVPSGDDTAAVVIDDAHLLSDDALRRLTEIADESDRTVVAAAQPRNHRPVLTALFTVLERERPRITLGPLTAGEVIRALSDPSGHPPPGDTLDAAMTATAGIPFLVSALAAHPGSPGSAVDLALNERLRRVDPHDLEALAIVSLSADLGAWDLAATLDVSTDRAAELIDHSRGTGLAEPSHPPEFLRAVHRAVASIIGVARHHELEKSLLRTQVTSSTLSEDLALELAEHGLRDDNLAGWLRDHAGNVHESADDQPTARARRLRAAVDAGAIDLRAGLADALALCADCTAAGALADTLLASPYPGERVDGARVAGSVAAHDGNIAYAAELFTWLGPVPDVTIGSAAAIAHLGSGDLTTARQAMEIAHSGPPTAAARAARSLADGMLLTLDAPYPAAAARLGRAVAGEYLGTRLAMPDSAPALVTLAALHSGDAIRARSVIGHAVQAGSDPAYATRHRLLQGWVRMQDGQLTAASVDAASAGLHARDALWAAALHTAIARRGGDSGALQHHLATGFDVLAEYSIDLYSLLPLGELWMAAARLRQLDRVMPALDQAFGVLDALGRPAAWAPLLHWAGVHAGILAGDPEAVAPHGQALTVLAEFSPFAAALAAAGRTWLQVLAGHVDTEAVIPAARGLARHGLTSDATRLAGQAALQAPDPKVSALMLQVARDLKLAVGDVPVDTVDSGGHPEPAPRPGPAATALSDREREVAELLVHGMPYRDIGAQLFISPKTVEHHVARIRRRLGAQSRPEMLSMLRAILA